MLILHTYILWKYLPLLLQIFWLNITLWLLGIPSYKPTAYGFPFIGHTLICFYSFPHTYSISVNIFVLQALSWLWINSLKLFTKSMTTAKDTGKKFLIRITDCLPRWLGQFILEAAKYKSTYSPHLYYSLISLKINK